MTTDTDPKTTLHYDHQEIQIENNPDSEPSKINRASRHGQSWTMLIALAIAALAFAAIVVLAGSWAYHHWHKPQPAPASTKDLPTPPPTGLNAS